MHDNDLTLVYDGECPFCARYVKLMRLRKSVGQLTILNARQSHPLIRELQDAGWDLNEGMVLKSGTQIYHGEQAIHALALMSSRAGWFNRLNHQIFKSARLSTMLYPLMRAGRNVVLVLLRRSKI